MWALYVDSVMAITENQSRSGSIAGPGAVHISGGTTMKTFGKRTAVAVAAVALGSAAFAGTAMANVTSGDGGNGGSGGGANANCLIPVGVTAGVIGQGGDNKQCNATAGGGGNGGGGVSY
jgi:hypothetical protein